MAGVKMWGPGSKSAVLALLVSLPIAVPSMNAAARDARNMDGAKKQPANAHVPPRSKRAPDTCAPFRKLGVSRTSAFVWRKAPRLAVSIHKSYSITFAVGHASARTENRFTIRLAVSTAPRTVNDLLFLACSGYYNGSQFYRVVANRLLEGGSPSHGTGPGFSAPVEPAHGSYVRGIVAMINPASTTEGGRFFVLLSPMTLPAQYTIVGTISHGMDVLESLSRVPVTAQPDAQELSRPRQVLIITGVSVDVQ